MSSDIGGEATTKQSRETPGEFLARHRKLAAQPQTTTPESNGFGVKQREDRAALIDPASAWAAAGATTEIDRLLHLEV